MFSPLRNRFGIPGVISVIALVFAMLGGAYAASNDGGGKATASAKAGANGKDGANGSNGAVGATGSAGKTGATGATGAEGSPWTAGGTLPSGRTETGTWADGDGKAVVTTGFSALKIGISFTIPLAAALDESHVGLWGFGSKEESRGLRQAI